MVGFGIVKSLKPEERNRYAGILGQVEMIEGRAHTALDRLIREGRTYHTIRIDMPERGIVDKGSGFDALCKKMNRLLVKGGKVVMLTDLVPNTDRNQLYLSTKGGRMRYTYSANVAGELIKAGFDVTFSPTDKQRVLDRSTTIADIQIRQRIAARKGKPIDHKYYMVIATKK